MEYTCENCKSRYTWDCEERYGGSCENFRFDENTLDDEELKLFRVIKHAIKEVLKENDILK